MTLIERRVGRGWKNGLQTTFRKLADNHTDCGDNRFCRHGNDALDVTFRAGDLVAECNWIDVENEGGDSATDRGAGEPIHMDAGGLCGFQKNNLAVGPNHSPHSARDRCSHDGHGESFRERESCAAKSLSWLIDSSNYEQSLEAMAA